MLQSSETIEVRVEHAGAFSAPVNDMSNQLRKSHTTAQRNSPFGRENNDDDDADGSGDRGYTMSVSTGADGSNLKRYQCGSCDKSYERLDHVKRHVNSHENTRPHKCKSCARRFNRRDLLIRHQAVHETVNPTTGKSKRPERVIQACQACTTAKTRCENRRPCTRCQKRKVPCVDTAPTRRAALLSIPDAFETAKSPEVMTDSPNISNSQLNQVRNQDTNSAVTDSLNSFTVFELADHQTSVDTGLNMADIATSVAGFQQVDAAPGVFLETLDWDNFNFHADLAHIYQDMDFNFDDELLSMHSEPWSFVDSTNADKTQKPDQNRPSMTDLERPMVDGHSQTIPSGHEAFKKSPWLWTPTQQDSAYSGHLQLAVDEDQIMTSPEMGETTRNMQRVLPNIADPGTRDELLGMTINFSKSALKLRSFPSHKLLNVLMQAFFVRDGANSDSFIHAPTFKPDKSRTELLAGFVAAGSTYFAIPNIWKMGFALQEVVKLAICDALDNDNRLARDLEANQTFVVWTELGLWNGFRRKMEVAEGFAHTVPTMLRRAGLFKQSYYNTTTYVPEITDEGEVLHQKWVEWARLESSKRLTFRVFMNEARSSIAFVRNPLLSATELTLTLPSARDLWDAPNAEEWKRLFLTKKGLATPLTLIDGIHDPSVLEEHGSVIDLSLSAHAILYALWGRIWTLLDSKSLYQHGAVSSKRATTQLLLEAQHQELYTGLKTVKEKLGHQGLLSAEVQLLCELLMMSLHASSADIQSFAGRFGEREFKQALPLLREWANRNEFYVATWHAGQVLRAARLLPPTSIRGFLAIAVYHASLLLWVAALLSRKSAAPSQNSPVGNSASKARFEGQASEVEVILDGDENAQTRAYLASEKGSPALHLANGTASLKDPSTIPAVMKEIFKQNFPSRVHPLPPLLENLVNLMEELSNSQQF